jgi:hypothetical protein
VNDSTAVKVTLGSNATIAFTLCSNNYISQARVLAESWGKYHPEIPFYIILVDRIDASVDYGNERGTFIVEIEKLRITALPYLARKYNIIELNVAVKPHAFEYLFEVVGARRVLYLDPDILVTGRFTTALNALTMRDCLLTPHILTPIREINNGPNDYHILTCGVYNLGFLGLRRCDPVKRFLTWWKARMAVYAFKDQSKGLFYDQVWFNYAHVFLRRAEILRHPGYNVANWNLHERRLSLRGKRIMVNERWPLIFFHFSHFKADDTTRLASYNARAESKIKGALRRLCADYRRAMTAKGFHKTNELLCYYCTFFSMAENSSNPSDELGDSGRIAVYTKERNHPVYLHQTSPITRKYGKLGAGVFRL